MPLLTVIFNNRGYASQQGGLQHRLDSLKSLSLYYPSRRCP
jgi:hypothetical protein